MERGDLQNCIRVGVAGGLSAGGYQRTLRVPRRHRGLHTLSTDWLGLKMLAKYKYWDYTPISKNWDENAHIGQLLGPPV
jgi:hypothetical protein